MGVHRISGSIVLMMAVSLLMQGGCSLIIPEVELIQGLAKLVGGLGEVKLFQGLAPLVGDLGEVGGVSRVKAGDRGE